MRFEETNVRLNGLGLKGGSEVVEMLSDFIKFGIEVAEIKDWELTHKSFNATYQALTKAVNGYFKKQIRVAKRGEHIYIARLEK